MRIPLISLVFALALGLAAPDADARRFGGGGNLGKQRATPTQREAAPAPAPAQQAKPAQPAAAPAAAGAAAAKPTFMSRWGGLLAGLGIGVLLASLFGAQLAPFVGMLLMGLLIGGIGYLLYRLLSPRKSAVAKPAAFAGIGSGLTPPATVIQDTTPQSAETPRRALPAIPPGFAVEPFVRVAKTSFIRLQAANDAKDLDDIRDYTTPEMYAELAMQIQERGDKAQKTEVVSLDAQLVDVAVEDGHEYASVRFWGLIREDDAANPSSFDEVWHVRKKAGTAKAPWLIAGIQQTP